MAQDDFFAVLSAAIDDMLQHGFDDIERVNAWTRKIREAAERSLIRPESLEQRLRDALASRYRKLVDDGEIERYHEGIDRFTLDRIKPALRGELDRRIAASANLIKLNRTESVEKTLRRFQGWSTSLPPGGVSGESRAEVRTNVRASMKSLPFEERRVIIDQSHKLFGAINEIVASDGGAIAGRWRSNYRQPGYNYRPEHKERDNEIYLIRDSWAHRAGLVKKGGNPYYDEITAVGQEPFCFPGDSRIPFADGVEKAYRRYFSGSLVILETASGRKVRATPNHPVLTPNGWVAVGALNEGDYVIEACRQSFDILKNNDDQYIPTIAEIFRAVCKSGGFQSTAKGQLNQFHGDGANGDVDIVDAARPLRFGRQIGAKEGGDHFCLTIPPINSAFARAFQFFFRRGVRACAGLMRRFSQTATAGFPFMTHSDRVCFALGPKDASSDRELSIDRMPIDAECFRQRENILSGIEAAPEFFEIDYHLGRQSSEFPFLPRPAQIVSTSREAFSGHVFNLQTTDGWYVADGIISHNCRCYMLWIYGLRELPPEYLTAKGKDALASAQGREEVRSARHRGDSAVPENEPKPAVGYEAIRRRLERLGNAI